MEGLVEEMKSKLTHNIGLKILALLVAVILWLIVVNIDDPVTTQLFTQIPVDILNSDAITDEGKTYQILENTDMISIYVTAKRTVLDSLNKDDFQATADMTEMTSVDTVPIEVKSTKNSDKIDGIEPKTKILKVSIEDLVDKQLVIDVTTSGKPADGYAVGETSSTQNIVRISGPLSVISQVAKAAVNVDVSGMSNDIYTTASLLLYDESDKPIISGEIHYNINEVSVYVTLLKEKELTIKGSSFGTPDSDYAETGVIDYKPDKVMVAGKENVLNKYSEIELPADLFDITGLNADLVKTINIENYLPSGLVLADGSKEADVEITVHIEPKQTKDIELNLSNFKIVNVPAGFKETLISSQVLLVKAMGSKENLESLDASAITGTIDFSLLNYGNGYTEGTYAVPITADMPSGVTLAGTSTVNVYLEKSTGLE